ncbi:hypothetical protein VKT23_004774 [Stygiomarasmius scandens]|uniref:Uncharacterized protein n=1 Tax=Marasmiellus scandens TaxID=2682957 RepID=A0ABR1JX33_9AGAR
MDHRLNKRENSYPLRRRAPRSRPLQRRNYDFVLVTSYGQSSTQSENATSADASQSSQGLVLGVGPQAPLGVSQVQSSSVSNWASSSFTSTTLPATSSSTIPVSTPASQAQTLVAAENSTNTSASSSFFATSNSTTSSLNQDHFQTSLSLASTASPSGSSISFSQIPFPTRTIPLILSTPSNPLGLFSSPAPTPSSSQSQSQNGNIIHSPPIYFAIALAALLIFSVLVATGAYIFRCCRRINNRKKRVSLEEMIIEAAERDREMGMSFPPDVYDDVDPELGTSSGVGQDQSQSQSQGEHLQIQFPTDPEFGTPRESVVKPRFLSLGTQGQGLDVPWGPPPIHPAQPQDVNAPIPAVLDEEESRREDGESTNPAVPRTRALPQAPPQATLPTRGTLSRASSFSSGPNFAPSLAQCPSDPFRDPSTYSHAYSCSYSSDSLPLPSQASFKSKSSAGMGWAFGFGSALSLASASSLSAPRATSRNPDIPSNIPTRAAEPSLEDSASKSGWTTSLKAGFVNAFHSAFRSVAPGPGSSDGLTRAPTRKASRRIAKRSGSTKTTWTIPESICENDYSGYEKGEWQGEGGGKEKEWIEYWGGELVGIAPGPSHSRSSSPAPRVIDSDTGIDEEELGKGLGLDLDLCSRSFPLETDADVDISVEAGSLSTFELAAPLIINKKNPSNSVPPGSQSSLSRYGTVKSVYSTYSTRSGISRDRASVSRANSIMTILDQKEEMASQALKDRWTRNRKNGDVDL